MKLITQAAGGAGNETTGCNVTGDSQADHELTTQIHQAERSSFSALL